MRMTLSLTLLTSCSPSHRLSSLWWTTGNLVLAGSLINNMSTGTHLKRLFIHPLLVARKVHTQSAKKWLERLQVEKVPVLVCLTFADKLYAEHMSDDGKHPEKEAMKFQLQQELVVSLSPGYCGTQSLYCHSFSSAAPSGDQEEAWLHPLPHGQVLLLQSRPRFSPQHRGREEEA